MAGKPGPETVETLKKKNHNVIQTVLKQTRKDEMKKETKRWKDCGVKNRSSDKN